MDVREKLSNERRLIDANKIINDIGLYMAENSYLNDTPLDILKMVADWIKYSQTVDAVEVVRCEKCALHGNCVAEDAFVLAGIKNPFCCAGRQKEGAD